MLENICISSDPQNFPIVEKAANPFLRNFLFVSDTRQGDPLRMQPLLPETDIFQWDSWGYGTVHVAAADAQGNLVALTPCGGWISANEVIPSLGFPLTSRLQTSYLDEQHPNAIAPGKRPRTTSSPSLVFRRGRPWMAFGTMGGHQQDQRTSQLFLNRVPFGMSVSGSYDFPSDNKIATICHAHYSIYKIHLFQTGEVVLTICYI